MENFWGNRIFGIFCYFLFGKMCIVLCFFSFCYAKHVCFCCLYNVFGWVSFVLAASRLFFWINFRVLCNFFVLFSYFDGFTARICKALAMFWWFLSSFLLRTKEFLIFLMVGAAVVGAIFSCLRAKRSTRDTKGDYLRMWGLKWETKTVCARQPDGPSGSCRVSKEIFND